MSDICSEILNSSEKTRSSDPKQMPALALAYIGDTLYDLYVRTILVSTKMISVCELHKQSSECVNAAAQARAAHLLMDEFTKTELAIYKRGRNAKSNTVPKNATIADYRAATGLEAVIGYLYLTNNEKRAFELLTTAMKNDATINLIEV